MIAQWSGDGTLAEMENTPKAKLNLIHCYRSMNYIARHMEEKFGIPWMEYNFFGPSQIAESLRKIAALFDDKIQANAEAVIAKYQPLIDGIIAKYKPRLDGKKVMLYVGGLRPRHVVDAYHDLGMEVTGTGYEFAHSDDYQRTTHYTKEGTLIYDDVTAYEFEKFVEKLDPDLVGFGHQGKVRLPEDGQAVPPDALLGLLRPVPRLRRVRHLRPRHGHGDQQPRVEADQGSLGLTLIKRRRHRGAVLWNRRRRRRPVIPAWNFLETNMPQNPEKVTRSRFSCSASRNTRKSSRASGPILSSATPDEEVARVAEWTKTEEYKEKNFSREALTINPAKACQPLGAVFAAQGFEGTLPFVHGSQGCVAYYRSHLLASLQGAEFRGFLVDDRRRGGVRRPEQHDRRSGQYLQPVPAEDDRRPDHLHGRSHRRRPAGLHRQREEQGQHPAGLRRAPYAHTPAFVGSHVTGYDNMVKGILNYFWDAPDAAARVPKTTASTSFRASTATRSATTVN